ncbi:MAG: MBL fold metallo-hydrolase [Pseudomonadales bacterium]|nr:MBL fold metallo-hydrolase [Pseudomonadales bacterium]
MVSSTASDPLLWHFFDPATSTFTHIVACPRTRRAAVIDPVHDFEPRSARFSTHSADQVMSLIRDESLVLEWILETHAHADHVSAAPLLQEALGGKIGIGEGIRAVQRTFSSVFDLDTSFRSDGSQFDRLFLSGDQFRLGELAVEVLSTPGHTLDSIAYLVGKHAFIGDTLFPPEYGTARCDFPGGDAGTLYDTIQTLHQLPAETLLHFCHDYPSDGSEPTEQVTVARSRSTNVHCNVATTRREFVTLRQARDETLASPQLLIPAVQLNIAAGRLPAPAHNGVVYLKTPINVIGRPVG